MDHACFLVDGFVHLGHAESLVRVDQIQKFCPAKVLDGWVIGMEWLLIREFLVSPLPPSPTRTPEWQSSLRSPVLPGSQAQIERGMTHAGPWP